MDELASHSTLTRITNVTIEMRNKCHTVDGDEEGRCGCGVGVIHRGILHDGAYPPAGGAHGNGQYLWPEGGGVVLELWHGWPAGGGGGHVEVYPVVGDPPHDITCFGHV
jgi:hypothetical protein